SCCATWSSSPSARWPIACASLAKHARAVSIVAGRFCANTCKATSREESRDEATARGKPIWLVRYANPDGSCDPRCCGLCPALPCNRAAAFAPCRVVVGGFAGVGGYARLPGLLDDRAGRNHSTALRGDSKLRCAAQPLIAGDGLRARLRLNSLDRWPLLAAKKLT